MSDAYGLLDYLSHPRVNCFHGEKINTLEETIADVKKREEDELQLSVCMKWDDTIIGNLFTLKEEPDTYNDLTNQKSSILASHTSQHKPTQDQNLQKSLPTQTHGRQKLCSKLIEK